jgi:hypothetical protein
MIVFMKKLFLFLIIMFTNCFYAFAEVGLKIDDTHFPVINLSITIEQEGVLNESNFDIKENEIFQDIGNFYSPQSFENYNAVDIVFVYDDSRSMQAESENVYTNIYAFVNILQSSGVDYRVGLVPFGGLDNSSVPDGTILNYGNLYDQNEPLFDDIHQMLMDGSIERAYCAISNAIQHIVWRSFSQKYIILITDEDNDTNGCDIDQNTLISRLTANNIYFYCFIDDSAGQASDNFAPIAEATEGGYYLIANSMAPVFNNLVTKMTSTYLIQYTTKDPLSSDTRNIVVNIDVDQELKTVEGYYLPNNLRISLTDSTQNLFSQAQTIQHAIPISATCSSDEAILKLYVKSAESSSYSCFEMNNDGNGLYTIAIPESYVLSPFLHFYLSAYREDQTVTLPVDDAHLSPFVLPVGYDPPEIIHTPETQSILAYSFQVISASVLFDRPDDIQLSLYYKSSSDYSYKSISESLPITNRSFQTTIPGASIYGKELQYYMLAKDSNGIAGYLGNSDAPISVDIKGYTVTQKASGNIIVYADIIEQDTTNPNKWIASGNIRVATRSGGNGLLGISSSVTLNTSTIKIEEDNEKDLTALNIKRNVNALAKDFPLYYGRFTIDGNQNPPVIHLIEGESRMELIDDISFLFSDEYQSQTITIQKNDIVLHHIYTELFGAIPLKLSVDNMVLSQSENSSEAITPGCMSCDNTIPINGLPGHLNQIKFMVDFANNHFSGQGDLYLKNISTAAFPANFQFVKNPLSVEGISGDLLGYTNVLSIPQKTNVLADVYKGQYLVSNLSSNGNKNVTGSKVKMKINNDRNIMQYVRNAADNLEIEIFTDKKMDFTGSINLLNHYPLENGKLHLQRGHNNVTGIFSLNNFPSQTDDDMSSASGNISGDIELEIDAFRSNMDVSGWNELDLDVPVDARWIGGKKIHQDFYFQIAYSSDGLEKSSIYTVYQHIDLTLTVQLDLADPEEPVLYIQGYTPTAEYPSAVLHQYGLKKRSQELAPFTISNDYEQLVLKIISQYNYPLFNLTVPTASGPKTYTPESASTNPVDIERNQLYFDFVAQANESFYVVNNPMQGDYIITVTNENDIGDYQVMLLGPNATPNISVDSPSTDIENPTTVTISWTANDPDNNPDISLYYDQDNAGNNGVLIADGFVEEGINTYTWTLPDDLLSGEYYIYAKIDDHENAPVFAYSSGKIIYKSISAPSIPTIVSTLPTDGGIAIQWAENDSEENVIAYRIYISYNPGSDIFDFNLAVSSTTDYTIEGLTSGHEYEIRMSAVNDESLESDLSNPIRITPTGNLQGSADLTIDSDHSYITSTTGKLENEIIVWARIENLSENDAQSAQISCYYGSMIASNLVQTLTVTSIPGKLTKDVSFSLNVSSAGNFYDLDIFYIVINNVLPSELEISNNLLSISNHLPFDYTLQLSEGFNLVSFPNDPMIASAASLIASISPNCSAIWEGYTRSYSLENPEINNLEIIKAGIAYWFEMKTDFSFVVTGTFPGRSVLLQPGWNWIGYNAMTERQIMEVFSGISNYKVLSYNQEKWRMFDSTSLSNDLLTMKPGYGYGIFVTESVTLTFP